ncbi:unnamed protein product [Rotaria sp. Silwood1]|nr:unnamed protein product [Rotaria sp. Silwood1]CAF1639917.1 unnamed protein product [Rotaria sp. Silwood1]CAF3858788.1 unnamed protein product [Rotaria sp. Silwood1]CAF4956267.1 unnamed protein product [Rotaria sp. Silwood1]CAF4968698.1 unnamed protein product [Rotaria sp. Silwood1]
MTKWDAALYDETQLKNQMSFDIIWSHVKLNNDTTYPYSFANENLDLILGLSLDFGIPTLLVSSSLVFSALKLDNNLIFHDRVDAGCQLAAHPYLQKIKSLPLNEKNSYLVISLPRGGTVVGDEVAKQLKITHDLVFSRKIPCPRQPEFAIGAVSELGDVIWNDYAKQEKLIDKPHVQQSKDKQIQEAQRRKKFIVVNVNHWKV